MGAGFFDCALLSSTRPDGRVRNCWVVILPCVMSLGFDNIAQPDSRRAGAIVQTAGPICDKFGWHALLRSGPRTLLSVKRPLLVECDPSSTIAAQAKSASTLVERLILC